MLPEALKTGLTEILPLRKLYLQETNTQIRYNASHERGWSDSYLLTVDGVHIGYGAVNGQHLEDRDTIFEFYIIPPYRKYTSLLFQKLLLACGATHIECQSNDPLLAPMIFEYSRHIHSDVILFEDYTATKYQRPDVIFRKRKRGERVFSHQHEPEGSHVLELHGEVVATGGFMLHYNVPFADLYMEVQPAYRQKGLGSFLIQELKRESYLSGRVPAARCNIFNYASKATLIKAGLRISGFLLEGAVRMSAGNATD